MRVNRFNDRQNPEVYEKLCPNKARVTSLARVWTLRKFLYQHSGQPTRLSVVKSENYTAVRVTSQHDRG